MPSNPLPSICNLEISLHLNIISDSTPNSTSTYSSASIFPFSHLCNVDWADELRLIATALLLAGVIILLLNHLTSTLLWQRLADWTVSLLHFHFPLLRPSSQLRTGPICGPRLINPEEEYRCRCTRRIEFTDDSATIYGWPSRGGVVILKGATRVDVEFLGLNAINPDPDTLEERREGGCGCIENEGMDVVEHQQQQKQQRQEKQGGEDMFCQRLLLLGAKWWDSEERFLVVSRIAGGDEGAIAESEEGGVEEPTLRERRWVCVGWEGGGMAAGSFGDGFDIDADADGGGGRGGKSDEHSDRSGSRSGRRGLWILDCDTTMYGILDEDNLVPPDAGRLCLAGSMEERCRILERLGATRFDDLEEYTGDETTFLRAWEWKWDGETREMLKY